MKFRYKNKKFDISGTSKGDHIYKSICNDRVFYEIDLLEYAAQLVKGPNKPDSLAIDAGANIGNHSIFFQSFIVEHLIAVEPNPDTLPILKSNLEKNIQHYTIYENGLGESFGQGSIILPDCDKGNKGMAQIGLGEGEIQVITLDALVKDWQDKNNLNGHVALIKIDVEGMELAVLKGAVETLKKYRPHLLIEATTPPKLEEFKEFLSEFGYGPICHFAATPVYHFCHKPTQYARLKAAFMKLYLKIKRRLLKIFS